METSGIVPTMSVGEHDGLGFGNGCGLWIFAILVLFLFGGNGGGLFGAKNQCASTQDLNDANNFARTEAQIRANADLTERKTDAINNGICSLGYEIANKFADTNERIANSQAQIKDLLYQNKIETLQSELQKLQMAQAMQGVVKYPMATTYSVPSCCFNGCNGQNI